jgi:hypothetical protein
MRNQTARRVSGLAILRPIDGRTPNGAFVVVRVLNYHHRSVRVGAIAYPSLHGYFTVGPVLREPTVIAECAVQRVEYSIIEPR